MRTSKTTKRALVGSLLALALCFAMLLGTTYAWFTDTADSTGNIIKSGTLNIDLLVKGGQFDTTGLTADSEGYYSLDGVADSSVFIYDKWEPGYAVLANVKVATTGNLALKYTLTIATVGTLTGDLANVIDVYYAAEEKNVTTREEIATELNYVGTLADVLAGTVVINDTLNPNTGNTADYTTLALVMQTSAGNEYQNLAIADAFTLKVVATQATYEADSFSTDYDANATYPD